ncbi:restriction endonuclease subunit S [Apilactobacillus kunkeei]|uniref:restriction endonuclease subunit S n=1 Tax=Apilactobacillus kunkeei TaxID=148814 RepID=UPI001129644F|nr:restriction endonuclease subunit S [Apilactobacillus kunkeei]TPR54976.1 hypothetical protein DY036_01190 [Apilactobacillus kunkeei]
MIDLTKSPDKIRASILQAAMSGQLTQQLPEDGTAEDLIKEIDNEKKCLIEEGKIKKQPPLPKIEEDEIPYNIPKNWKWVRLENLLDFNKGSLRRGPFGSSITKSMFVSKGKDTYKVYEQGNAIRGSSNYGDYYINLKKYEELKSFSVKPNDIIVSCAGTIGKTFVIPNGSPEGIINQALIRIRLNRKVINEKFFLLLFKQNLNLIKSRAIGSAIKNMASIKVLKNELVWSLPPLAEQQRIVDKLDELLPKVSELKENTDKLEQLRKDFPNKIRQSLLKAAMKGELTNQLPEDGSAEDLLKEIDDEKKRLIEEGKIKKQKALPDIEDDEIPFDIPKNWKWVRLGDITEISTGNTPNKGNELYYNSNDVEFVKPGDLNGKCITSAKEYISNSALKTSRVANKNSIFVVGIGGSIGKIGINKLNCAFNQQLHNINPICVNYTFIYYTMMSNIIKTQFQNKSGTATPIVNKSKLRSFILPLPPLPEQKRIVEKLDKLFKELNN